MALFLFGLLGLAAGFEMLCEQAREPYCPVMTGSASFDQDYLRKMTAHHQVGREMALMAADRSANERLKTLARMMTAEQQAEIDALQRWWRGWFGGNMPSLPESELAKMPGMPAPEALQALSSLQGSAFEREFVKTMIIHHRAAIEMSSRAENEAADPRLRLLADQIIHAQGRQIIHMEQLLLKKGRSEKPFGRWIAVSKKSFDKRPRKGNSMNKKEFAKFAAGVETFHALIHGVLWLTDTNLRVFGIKATRKWNMAATALNGASALALGLYAWRPDRRQPAKV